MGCNPSLHFFYQRIKRIFFFLVANSFHINLFANVYIFTQMPSVGSQRLSRPVAIRPLVFSFFVFVLFTVSVITN